MNKYFHTVLNRMKSFFPIEEKQNNTILIACSGGADSMFLTFALRKLNFKIKVLHLTHDMRPSSETDKDKNIVVSLCTSIGVQVIHRHVYGKNMVGNLESNYRNLQYQLFEQIAKEEDCSFVATGHNADDQLETVLMNMCRGCGFNGLRGIAVDRIISDLSNIRVIRPMIDLTKDQVYSQCKEFDIPFHEDITNADEEYTRNNLRKNVLPVLKSMFPKCSQKAVKLGEMMANLKDEDTNEK